MFTRTPGVVACAVYCLTPAPGDESMTFAANPMQPRNPRRRERWSQMAILLFWDAGGIVMGRIAYAGSLEFAIRGFVEFIRYRARIMTSELLSAK